MSHMIRIGAGVSAVAVAIALGIAFWPQIDTSMAHGRIAVEKPIFVVPAAPVKLEAALGRPQAAAPEPAAAPPTPPPAETAPAPSAAAGVTVVPGSQPTSDDDAPLA